MNFFLVITFNLISVSYQRGFVEREINDVLRGLAKKEDPRRRAVAARIARNAAKGDTTYHHTDGREALQQREITEEDVCPICQDELLGNREPVTYCRSVLYSFNIS